MNNKATEENEPLPVETAKPELMDQDEVPEALEFLRENGVAIVVGVLVAVAGFVGYTIWKNSKAAKVEAASSLLANSQTAPQFQEIIANYPDTPSAPLAQLALAGAYFDENQFDLAQTTFAQFSEKFPGHAMSPVAELGVAQSLEGLNRYDEALAAYDNYLTKNPAHFMVPSATFGKARVLEAQQKFAEAKQVYEAFIAANPESPWINRAETGLDFVGKQERATQAQ